MTVITAQNSTKTKVRTNAKTLYTCHKKIADSLEELYGFLCTSPQLLRLGVTRLTDVSLV